PAPASPPCRAVRSAVRRTLLRRQLQAIADAEFGEDMGRPGGVGFQLLPQPAYENTKILNLLGLRGSPDFAQQLAMSEHLAGMADEQPQELELLGRELDFLPSADHLTAH